MAIENADAPGCSFRVKHSRLSAEQIVQLVGLEATVSWTVGEPRKGLDGRALQGIHAESYCTFAVPIRDEDSVESDLLSFLKQLAARRKQISGLSDTGGTLAMYLIWKSRRPSGFQFKLPVIHALSALGIELWLEAI